MNTLVKIAVATAFVSVSAAVLANSAIPRTVNLGGTTVSLSSNGQIDTTKLTTKTITGTTQQWTYNLKCNWDAPVAKKATIYLSIASDGSSFSENNQTVAAPCTLASGSTVQCKLNSEKGSFSLPRVQHDDHWLKFGLLNGPAQQAVDAATLNATVRISSCIATINPGS